MSKNTPETARISNRVAVLNELRRQDGLSRVDLSRITNLSKMTISAIVGDLVDERLVRETGRGVAASAGGRRPILLEIDSSWFRLFAVDVGRSRVQAVVADLQGSIVEERVEPTPDDATPRRITDTIGKLFTSCAKKAGLSEGQLLGASVSIGGLIDRSRGLVHRSPDFGWDEVALRDMVQKKLRCDVVVENCTRAMALGELWYSQAVAEARDLLYVNLGYGIGSAMIINGNLYQGMSELGHFYVTKKDLLCSCGKTGCLEAVASGSAIARRYRAECKAGSRIDAKGVADRARKGEECAIATIRDAGRYIGRAAALAANLYSPQKITFGGGLTGMGDLLLDPIQEEFDTRVMPTIGSGVSLGLSELGNRAGIMGTVALGLDHFTFSVRQ